MRIALYQPDIPQNTGTILRMAACFAVPTDIIEPAGFNLSDRALKRAGMDYLDLAQVTRHLSYEHFRAAAGSSRILLLTTGATTPFHTCDYRPDDILLFGRESAGVPGHVHDTAHARLVIPISPHTRSLNLAVSVAMVLSEALRQIGGFPETED